MEHTLKTSTDQEWLNIKMPFMLYFEPIGENEYKAKCLGLDVADIKRLIDQDKFDIKIRPNSKSYIEVIATKK